MGDIHSTSKHRENLRCGGVSRIASMPTCLLFSFSRVPSDNEIRELKDKIDDWLGEPAASRVSTSVIDEVAAERRLQIEEDGSTAEHHDRYRAEEVRDD